MNKFDLKKNDFIVYVQAQRSAYYEYWFNLVVCFLIFFLIAISNVYPLGLKLIFLIGVIVLIIFVFVSFYRELLHLRKLFNIEG